MTIKQQAAKIIQEAWERARHVDEIQNSMIKALIPYLEKIEQLEKEKHAYLQNPQGNSPSIPKS